jgi:AcrR family transcriptional regulator
MAAAAQASGRSRDVRLTEEGIYAAALRLIDADGVGALSMRKLAAALEVNPMSLYHHVPNRAALLRGVKNLVAAQFPSTASGGTWQDQLRQVAYDFRSLAHRHRNLVMYAFASPDSIEPEDRFWQALCRILETAGVPSTEVTRIGAVLTSLFSGFILGEANGSVERLSAMSAAGRASATEEAANSTDADRTFELAVRILITGLAAQLERPGATSA